MLTLEFVCGVVQVQVPVASSSTLQKDPLPSLRVATTTHNVFLQTEGDSDSQVGCTKKEKNNLFIYRIIDIIIAIDR